jgi:DnaJ-class molecular chaperone
MRDPYDVLGVPKSAGEADIKKAFRKLAKQHHPDRNANDPKAKDKFAEVNSAYEILGDADKRAQFDRGEIDGEGKPRFQGFEGFPGGAGGGEDIFSHLFGDALKGGGRGRTMRGDDIEATLTVDIEDLAKEEKQRITLPGGREVEVTLPPGITDGQTVRLRGLGRPGARGAESGDLLLTLRIAPQERYTIDGSDLRLRLPVDLEDAVLGGKVRVPTPTGAVEMNIPAMTSSGRTFRLRGKGLPKKGGKGDLLVTAEIRLPENMDDDLAEYARKRRGAKVE